MRASAGGGQASGGAPAARGGPIRGFAWGGAGGDGGIEGDDWAEAVPSADELAIELGEGGSVAGALSVEGGVVGDPAVLRDRAQAVASGLNRLVGDTHASIHGLVTEGHSTSFQIGGLDCRVWQAPGPKVEWQLVSCARDHKARRYAFVLRGRPLGSTDDDAYLPVFAGEGTILPRFEGARRGHGWVGYDFDHLGALTGDPVKGRLGIGYRAAGRARQLKIGLDGVKSPLAADTHTGVFRYARVVGLGGRFSFVTRADVLAKEADGGVKGGQDGVNELVRAVFAWRADQRFRTVVAACDGTLQDPKTCLRVAQCWAADQKVTFESFLDPAQPIAWEEAKCGPDTPFAPEEPPEGDLVAPDPKPAPHIEGEDIEAPWVETPAGIPEE